MGHVILLGDSIFDNQRYVPGHPAVIEQVRRNLPTGWTAKLLALDGGMVEDVLFQLKGLSHDATHLFISVGGNDALSEASMLREPAATVGEAMYMLSEVRQRFQAEYRKMLDGVRTLGKPTVICTVYDTIPGLGPAEKTALASFNEIILREAVVKRLPVIDLRILCNQTSDYSTVSPIEPSVTGGAKIARVIGEIVAGHDFRTAHSVIYS